MARLLCGLPVSVLTFLFCLLWYDFPAIGLGPPRDFLSRFHGLQILDLALGEVSDEGWPPQ